MPDDPAHAFETLAKLRDAASENRQLAESALETVQRIRDQVLAATTTLTDDERAAYRDQNAALLTSLRTMQRSTHRQLMTALTVLDGVDPENPEHVATLQALAEGMEATAATLRAEAMGVNLLHEARRRVG